MQPKTFKIGGELQINRLGFGAMRITGPGVWGEPADRSGAIATLKKLAELDVNFIDTADSYGPNISEQLIHDALFPYPKNPSLRRRRASFAPDPTSGFRLAHPTISFNKRTPAASASASIKSHSGNSTESIQRSRVTSNSAPSRIFRPKASSATSASAKFR